jgi:hypothetical protein
MKKKANRKKGQKKRKSSATKKVASKAKLAARGKAGAKGKPKLKKKAPSAVAAVQSGSQSVETVSLKPKALVARAGTGAGDYQGISAVADVDSESAEELLEEGQAFEAGIISGVEDASDPDEAEVTTHEVPQDDVPNEYDDKDHP